MTQEQPRQIEFRVRWSKDDYGSEARFKTRAEVESFLELAPPGSVVEWRERGGSWKVER